MSFHSPEYVGYFPTDGHFCSPLEGQHQHNLVPVHSSYSTYDDGFGHYENYAQLPAPPILPSSSSSELGHALVETPPPESQPINHGSIALPSLAMPSPSVPKHELSETLVGLNAVKTEYASAVNGQPFSPITSSLSTLPLSPRPKEEGQDQVHVSPLLECHMAVCIIIHNASTIRSAWFLTQPRTGDILLRPHLRFVRRPFASLVTYTYLAG